MNPQPEPETEYDRMVAALTSQIADVLGNFVGQPLIREEAKAQLNSYFETLKPQLDGGVELIVEGGTPDGYLHSKIVAQPSSPLYPRLRLAEFENKVLELTKRYPHRTHKKRQRDWEYKQLLLEYVDVLILQAETQAEADREFAESVQKRSWEETVKLHEEGEITLYYPDGRRLSRNYFRGWEKNWAKQRAKNARLAR